MKKEALAVQNRVLNLSLTSVLMIYLALSLFPAAATLQLVEKSTKTKGATTVTWDSSFQDMDYTLGDTITMTVTWTVDAGVATYDSFGLRGPKFTPKGKDPATGTEPTVSQSGNTVTVTFSFTDLHLDRERNVEIGNAKFKLYLWVDEDGNSVVETLAGYGVNIHVEDPL